MNKKEKEVLDLTVAYAEACRAVDTALKTKETLASSLLLLIPKDQQVGRVKHIVESKGSPSWKRIAEMVKNELVPKSKWDLVNDIIEANTGAPRDYIRLMPEGSV